MLIFLGIHETQIGLMYKGSGLERLSRLLLGDLLSGQLPQFVVDQRQKLLGGVWVALLDCG
jgi:hypothetical protein